MVDPANAEPPYKNMEAWKFLLDVLILLATALALGALCERVKQSAILGYLLAGTLLGPSALNVVQTSTQVDVLAELGVTLLLFTIGLEFSFGRLRGLGGKVLIGGVFQVIVTMLVASLAAAVFGLDLKSAMVVGGAIALSSTACVLRILTSNAQLDSIHGRNSLGVLLIQDIAVVPLVLLVSTLRGEGGFGEIVFELGKAIVLGGVLLVVFFAVFNYVVPWLLGSDAMRRNRELPTLLAIVVGLGSAFAAHQVNLSPALGAFAAGILLAESPFATQVRADVTSLRTLLMTLFFSSVGMLADPAWIAGNLPLVIGATVGVVVGKAMVIWFILRRLGQSHGPALASGFCLAQIGEFSFVLLGVARDSIISQDVFLLMISTTIITLFITPVFVVTSPTLAEACLKPLRKLGWIKSQPWQPESQQHGLKDHLIIVGYGPAGEAVVHAMRGQRPLVVIDMNRRVIKEAKRLEFMAHVGDATSSSVLEHAHIHTADAIIITLPDPNQSRQIIEEVRNIAPEVTIVARSRYHVHMWQLRYAGAHVVVDEEEEVGKRLAAEVGLQLTSKPVPTHD